MGDRLLGRWRQVLHAKSRSTQGRLPQKSPDQADLSSMQHFMRRTEEQRTKFGVVHGIGFDDRVVEFISGMLIELVKALRVDAGQHVSNLARRWVLIRIGLRGRTLIELTQESFRYQRLVLGLLATQSEQRQHVL